MDDLIRTCGATTSAGTPCKRAPIIGGFRCTLHGGASPEAKRMANEALLGARLPAARFLFDLIENYSRATCPTCQMPTGDPNPVIRAAIAVLDRTGYGPSAHVTLTHETTNEFEGMDDDEALDLLQARLARVQAMLDLARRSRESNTVEGDFFVPSDDEPAAVHAGDVQVPEGIDTRDN